ncbi:MAG: hypothetical protein KDJ75_06075 [Alphaproteobacteria bacterium]|nr:hypothetical protein [Alphaproteobacteria bacterium]
MDFLNNTKKKAMVAVLPVFLGVSGCAQMTHKATAPQTDREAFCREYADQSTGTVQERAVDAGVGTAIGAAIGAVAGAVAPGISTGKGALFGGGAGLTTKIVQQDSEYSRVFNDCMRNPQYNQPQQPQTVLPRTKPDVPSSVTPGAGGSQMYQGPMLPVR